jgi:hypothetical protein
VNCLYGDCDGHSSIVNRNRNRLPSLSGIETKTAWQIDGQNSGTILSRPSEALVGTRIIK